MNDQDISVAVIRKVAAAEGVKPESLEPQLHRVIDPDGLKTVCASMTNGRVTFEYAGYEVTVTSDQEIMVAAPQ